MYVVKNKSTNGIDYHDLTISINKQKGQTVKKSCKFAYL